MRFDRRAVTDPGADALLRHYFTSRELGFTGDAGYRIVPPDPARFTPPAGAFLIAVDETTGAEVGCGGVRRIDPEPDGAIRFEVKHLWVEEAARGGGTGRALLVALEAEAASLGAETIVLDTNASLEAAGRLYRSSGYVGVPPFNHNPNATDWFRKDLRNPHPHARDEGLPVTGSDPGSERKRDSF